MKLISHRGISSSSYVDWVRSTNLTLLALRFRILTYRSIRLIYDVCCNEITTQDWLEGCDENLCPIFRFAYSVFHLWYSLMKLHCAPRNNYWEYTYNPPSQPCFIIRFEFVYYWVRGFFRWILRLFSFVKKEQFTLFCFNLIACAKL